LFSIDKLEINGAKPNMWAIQRGKQNTANLGRMSSRRIFSTRKKEIHCNRHVRNQIEQNKETVCVAQKVENNNKGGVGIRE
jgi:hypothetical protein